MPAEMKSPGSLAIARNASSRLLRIWAFVCVPMARSPQLLGAVSQNFAPVEVVAVTANRIPAPRSHTARSQQGGEPG
jgi:hypothetical protein